MVTFDINGAIVEFDEKTDNYNSIRKSFKNQAEYARDNFKNMTNVFVSTVWNEVEKTLRKSDLLIFCGYSFADADIHIKYMIKRVQTSRKKAPLKFMVFNSYEGKREDSKRKEEERYKRFLGEGVIFTDNSFEEFATDPLRFINVVN